MTKALSIREVGTVLGVHVTTARQYIREGRITHVHVGNRIRVGEAQLEAFLAGERSSRVCEICRPLAKQLRVAS